MSKITNKTTISGLTYGLVALIGSALIAMPLSGQATHNREERYQQKTLIEDNQIILELENSIKQDPILKELSTISMVAYAGQLQLLGTVDTELQAEKLIALAQSNPHVREVEAKGLKIKKSTTPMQDLYITAKAKGLLMKPEFANWFTDIHVTTKNRVIYLTGTMEDAQKLRAYLQQVKALNGVKSVKNSIELR